MTNDSSPYSCSFHELTFNTHREFLDHLDAEHADASLRAPALGDDLKPDRDRLQRDPALGRPLQVSESRIPRYAHRVVHADEQMWYVFDTADGNVAVANWCPTNRAKQHVESFPTLGLATIRQRERRRIETRHHWFRFALIWFFVFLGFGSVLWITA